MKRRNLLLLLLLCAVPGAMAADHKSTAPKPPKPPEIVYHGEAIINRVDAGLGLLNLTHGPVALTGWGVMTRDLKAKPKHLVNGLMPGMKIKFQLTAVDQMTWVITAIKPIP